MDARKWIEDVLGEKVAWGSDDDGPGSGFAHGLKSGEVLCKYVIIIIMIVITIIIIMVYRQSIHTKTGSTSVTN